MSKLEPTRTCSNPTETDVLRRLLDECGVEWDYGIAGATTTRFSVNGIDLTFTPMRDGLVCSTILTPEQAIAATLGSFNCANSERTNETCQDVYPKAKYCFTCSECGHIRRFVQGWNGVNDSRQDEFHYCPNCGRKVVNE